MRVLKNIGKALVEKIDLPAEAISGMPQIAMLGDTQISVEGYKAILEYGENAITLDCGSVMVEILGAGLYIKSFTKNVLLAAGKILSVSFRV